MNDFKTALMIDKIKSQKYAKGLIEDMNTIKDWYYTDALFLKNDNYHTLICNAYKCFTLAMSHYITKCSLPLSIDVYKVKHSMETGILSEEFLDTSESTYEWLISTFQYTGNIPANTLSGKQVVIEHNLDYTMLNKLALLVKDRTIPFTIDFNSNLTPYYTNIIFNITNTSQKIMRELVLIETLKSRANSNIRYTLFEEVINEKLEELLKFKSPLSFIPSIERLYESIQSMEALNSKYLRIRNKRKHNE